MCDLIDLNSPSTKDLAVVKLASPLIPVPTDSGCGLHANGVNEAYPEGTGKRDSLENNPFDMVLHKTTEYIQKKNDPFEVTLERALRCKNRRSVSIRTNSADLADGFTPKHKKQVQAAKLNRTLDEYLVNESLNKKKPVDQSMIMNVNDTNKVRSLNAADDCTVPVIQNKMPAIEVQNMDVTILDQATLNDTLSDMFCEPDEDQQKSNLLHKISTIRQKNEIIAKQIMLSDVELKVPKLRRSHSQGENMSLKKVKHFNRTSQSILDILRTSSTGGKSTVSSISSGNTDPLNEGFLKSRCSESSVFSSLSNISAISKLSSVSSTSNLSVALSNRTMDRTFLESCSSENIDNAKIGKKNKSVREGTTSSVTTESMSSVNLLLNGNERAHTSISDLTDRLNKLKTNSSAHSISQDSSSNKSPFISNCSNVPTDAITVLEKQQTDRDNKLIDVDVFSPEENCNNENSRSSVSDVSSDSVFNDGSNKINKSILREAKALARTFEELALKSSSGSSVDDLMNSNPSWTCELLPAFDDEDIVGNLIELPISPNTNGEKNTSSVQTVYNQVPLENKDGDTSDDKKEKNLKDLEESLYPESANAENKVAAATLLFDLRKLIETEKNKTASTLLENLEKVLGVECKNNTELLSTYLNTTNNLAKSPQKSNEGVDIVKNVEEQSMEKSQEENVQIGLENNAVDQKLSKDMNINSSNIMKHCENKKKYLKDFSNEADSVGRDENSAPANSIKELNKSSKETESQLSITDSVEKSSSNSIYKEACDKPNSYNEKVATELLTNLGKLLNGQVEEQLTTNILKNLGKVLNIASNHYAESKTKTDSSDTEIQQTPKKPKMRPERKRHSSVLSNSAGRLSLDLDSKNKPASNVLRRSISVSQSPPVRNGPTPLIPKNKNTSHVKDVKNRFPSDPGIGESKKGQILDVDFDKISDTKKGKLPKVPGALEKEKRLMIPDTAKSKLKKRPDVEIVSKKGPMKALLPVGNMQKRQSMNKKSSTAGTVTPPKTHKIISSTPNAADKECAMKKSPRSKPVASSTPDAYNSKMRRVVPQSLSCSKKRNFSCDISPVVTYTDSGNAIRESPKRANKIPSPKKLTPKRRQTASSIPKLSSSPVIKTANASFDGNIQTQVSESPKRCMKNGMNLRRTPLTPTETIRDKTQHSPLRDSNKLSPKVKPFNLITKLRRHSQDSNVMEKENNYI